METTSPADAMRATLAVGNWIVIESGELAADPSNVEFLTRFD